jgi:exo-1,4-beta-D-glucosaminidase
MIHPLERWLVQSSSVVASTGSELSRRGAEHHVTPWYSARLPATVLAVLVEHGVYPDPFVGKNFLALPGRGPDHQNFSNHPMPEDSPFRVPWWFCCELPPVTAGRHTWLELDGLNYRANLFVNGTLVADSSELAGAYRSFTLLLDEHLSSRENHLALQVFPPNPDDLAITWVDWNPSPPDKNLGLWRPARLRTTGALRIAEAQARSSFSEPGFARAELEVFVTIENARDQPVEGTLELSLSGGSVRRTLELGPRERRELCLSSSDLPTLAMSRPRLWWPRGRGEQPLLQLELVARHDGIVSDTRRVEHGIREITCELTDEEHSLFRVNGKPILIRGGGWARDMLLRSNAERELYEYEFVKDLGLNTIRFEGMVESGEFLSRCDRDGVLVLAGFCCCDHWEKWDNWRAEDLPIAEASLRSELRRLRNHPCLLAWWYGSDFPPPPHVEERYLAVLAEERWPNPAHSSAAAKPTALTGPSGMKMAGPYDYVPPSYWLEDTERGGAFGFATEIGPGPAIPPLSTLRSMLGDEHLWPPDECWTLHSGGGPFKDRTLFDDALAARYGAPTGVEDYCFKAQLACYEAQRAMFEAYARRKYRATGVIQWMLNNAWPSLIWHLWDHALCAAGGYFGTKKACEPLHIQYDAGEETISVVSELVEPARQVQARVRLFELTSRKAASPSESPAQGQLRECFRYETTLDVLPDAVVTLCRLPDRQPFGETHFLLLELSGPSQGVPAEGSQRSLARNFYWLSNAADVVDHSAANWFMAPMLAHARFHVLAELPRPELHLELLSRSLVDEPGPARHQLSVKLSNRGDSLAFFTRLELVDAEGRELLPSLYSDNYISLLPGESCEVQVRTHRLPAGASLTARSGPAPRALPSPGAPLVALCL